MKWKNEPEKIVHENKDGPASSNLRRRGGGVRKGCWSPENGGTRLKPRVAYNCAELEIGVRWN